MRRLLIVSAAILLAQLIAITSLAQQAEPAKPKEQTPQKGLEGRWTGTVQTPQGENETGASFKKEGDNFTGTFAGPQGDIPFKSIKVDGEKVAATIEIEGPNGNVVINFSFTLKEDSLKGKGEVSFNGQNIALDINLKRAAEK